MLISAAIANGTRGCGTAAAPPARGRPTFTREEEGKMAHLLICLARRLTSFDDSYPSLTPAITGNRLSTIIEYRSSPFKLTSNDQIAQEGSKTRVPSLDRSGLRVVEGRRANRGSGAAKRRKMLLRVHSSHAHASSRSPSFTTTQLPASRAVADHLNRPTRRGRVFMLAVTGERGKTSSVRQHSRWAT